MQKRVGRLGRETLLSLIVALALVLGQVPLTAFAETSGQAGQEVSTDTAGKASGTEFQEAPDGQASASGQTQSLDLNQTQPQVEKTGLPESDAPSTVSTETSTDSSGDAGVADASSKTHLVKIEASENGQTTTLPKDKATAGEKVKVTCAANDGYELDELDVTDSSNKKIDVTDGEFEMPDSDVNVKATYKKLEKAPSSDTTASIASDTGSNAGNASYDGNSTSDADGDEVQTTPSAYRIMNAFRTLGAPLLTQSATHSFYVYNQDSRGTVSVSPSTGEAAAGDTVSVTVTPNTGWEVSTIAFRPQSIPGDPLDYTVSGNTYTVTMPDVDMWVGIEYEPVEGTQLYNISFERNEHAYGGVDYYQYDRPAGEKVTLKPSATTGYAIKDISVKNNTTQEDIALSGKYGTEFIMPASDVTVTLTTEPATECGLAVGIVGNGTTTTTIADNVGNVHSIKDTGNISAYYGQTVELSATPDSGSRFVGWYKGIFERDPSKPGYGFVHDYDPSALISSDAEYGYTLAADAPTAVCAVFEDTSTHTVSFDTGGRFAVPESQEVEDGAYATNPGSPSYLPSTQATDGSGLWFHAWYREAPDASFTYTDLCQSRSGGGKIFSFGEEPITADTTVYAGWDATIEAACYDLTTGASNKGGMTRASSVYYDRAPYSVYGGGVTAIAGTEATVQAQPDVGYTFVGWSTSTSTDDIVSTDATYSFPVTQKAKYYALFKSTASDLTISFSNSDFMTHPIDEVISSLTVNGNSWDVPTAFGESVTKPVTAGMGVTITVETKDGASMGRVWADDSSGITNLDVEYADDWSSATITFTMPEDAAQINISASKSFFVHYDVNGGTKAEGWPGDSVPYLASLRPTFTSWSVMPIDVATGKPMATPPEGYRFAGFEITDDNGTHTGAPGTTITGLDFSTVEPTIKFLWEPLTQVFVYYSAGDGTGSTVFAGTAFAGSQLDVRTFESFSTFSAPEHKRFDGWDISDGDVTHITAEQVADGYALTVPEFPGETTPWITLTASYVDDTKSVTYHTNGGTGSVSDGDSVTVYNGDTISAPAEMQKAGRLLAGWYTNEELTERYDFSEPVTEDLDLYAGWRVRVDFAATIYGSPTGELGGGTILYDGISVQTSTQWVMEGTEMTLTAQPAEGWQFDNWGKNAPDNPQLGPDETLTFNADDSVAWYAVFERIPVTVSFDVNGGTPAIEDQELFYGDKAAKPAALLAKGDWAFGGWYLDELYTSEYDFETTLTEDIELHARWNGKIDVLTYDKTLEQNTSGGTFDIESVVGVEEGNYSYGSGSIAEGTPVKLTAHPAEGYRFVGWAEGDDPGNIVSTEGEYEFTMASPSIRLQAVFEEKPVTLTIHWSSIDGVDLMEPIKCEGIKKGTEFEQALVDHSYILYVTVPFEKAGYIGKSGFWLYEPITNYSSYDELYTVRCGADDLISEDTDVYYTMFKSIDKIELAIEAPVCGTTTKSDDPDVPWEGQTNPPVVTIADGQHFTFDDDDGKIGAWWTDDSGANAFEGTFDGGQTYHFASWYDVEFGYKFAEGATISLDGGTFEDYNCDGKDAGVWGSVNAVHDPAEPVKENIVEASCTKAGSYDEVVYCSACDEELSREHKTVEALGHDWGEWKVVKEATEDADGLEERACSRCEETESRAIPKLVAKYYVESGDGAFWIKSLSKRDLQFVFKRTVNDDKTFGLFKALYVDGKKLSDSDFSVESGSVVATLNASYLTTLPEGEHTLKAVFEDGEASATFNVYEMAPINISGKAFSGTPRAKTGIVKTGDALPVAVIVVTGVIAAAVALMAAGKRRKKR